MQGGSVRCPVRASCHATASTSTQLVPALIRPSCSRPSACLNHHTTVQSACAQHARVVRTQQRPHSIVALRAVGPGDEQRMLSGSAGPQAQSNAGTASGAQYDEETKTVRVPLHGEGGARRTKLVSFTCNKCGGRTSRAVNPLAWDKGLVFGQCGKCQAWHVLSANNPKLYEEIRYGKDSGNGDAEPVMVDAQPLGESRGESDSETPL